MLTIYTVGMNDFWTVKEKNIKAWLLAEYCPYREYKGIFEGKDTWNGYLEYLNELYNDFMNNLNRFTEEPYIDWNGTGYRTIYIMPCLKEGI